MNYIILGILFVYTMPLWKLRYLWRGQVYKDYSFSVNYKPDFIAETKALFSNKGFSKKEKRFANLFRSYLLGYFFLIFLL